MPISDLSHKLLRMHAQRPDELLYGIKALGGAFRETDVQRLDEAYDELAKAGLLEKTGAVLSFFGAPKRIYKITPLGTELATRGSAA